MRNIGQTILAFLIFCGSAARAADYGTLPRKLSQLALFLDASANAPARNVYPYDVRFPLWSDGASKRRWFFLPAGSRAELPAAGGESPWLLPVGTILAKEFKFERRVETRVMRRTDDGWEMASYKWLEDQSDAVRVEQSEDVVVELEPVTGTTGTWRIPASEDCASCHGQMSAPVRGPLGVSIAQWGVPQLKTWIENSRIANPPADVAQEEYYPERSMSSLTSKDEFARAYLAVNCASCHRPGGFVPTSLDFSWRTPVAAMNAVEVNPRFGRMGIADAKIIKLNEKEKSVLWQRMNRSGPQHMPYYGAALVDRDATDIIGRWIDDSLR